MGKNAPLPEGLQRSVKATKVEYKQLGKCGLRVSVPILGGMSFGHKDWMEWVVDDEDAVMELLKAAWDRGLNTWDTANVYSNGLSEEMIGRAMKKFEIPRQKIVLMTKCWGTVGEEPGLLFLRNPEMMATRDYINQGGLSRAAIFNAVNDSLKRLDTHYIDLLQIHRYDPSVPVEETMKALHDLVEAGKVRYIGASSMWTYQFARMQFVAESRGWTKFVSMQNQYSLCYREEEREMIKFCHETGVGLVPWSPLRSGFLARPLEAQPTLRSEFTKNTTILPDGDKLYSEADREINHRVEELANKKGWKMSQVALIWAVQRGTVPIVGFSSVARVEEASELMGKSLTDAEMAYLEEPYIPKQVSGHV